MSLSSSFFNAVHMEYKVSWLRKINATLWMFLAWFAPLNCLRVFFHRLRGVKIGKGVFIGWYCIFDNVHPELITIEDNVAVAANSVILTHEDYMPTALGLSQSVIKPVRIKKGAKLAINVMVLPGVTIGENALIGANIVVSKDVPDNTLVVDSRKIMMVPIK